ncbi:prolyl-tRNA editing enzyme YbaK/EbsC (Cys-tRNA(Pro) deacylase) [Ureibacillus xyleni]|uniref:Prolyl-tRNA editing enzyme YbaK/EbsC (Cys-tRNA(Pro) deacylase) n=1 Tax=Ureibacillus xyleni TaxID=614648 RepID=A0A285TBT0_9BACL|nr:YbaK/EbsC family protein [Ureibacillus xyleni]SOC19548.1 prolyl-tRNA editing enzyme YbaK/EbsC (Cys-tRNA(Pro) deacylase) [Ureibacillus xyleni]
MSLSSVKEHFKKFNREQDILEYNQSSATVEQAANALNVIPAKIAKTLSFKDKEGNAFLVVTAGDAKIDNKKFKEEFGTKPKMLNAEEVVEQTGHVVGGVCPFGLANPLSIFLDVSMQRFQTVFPACGSVNSAIELTCAELLEYSGANAWVDVSKDWDATLQETVIKEDSHV